MSAVSHLGAVAVTTVALVIVALLLVVAVDKSNQSSSRLRKFAYQASWTAIATVGTAAAVAAWLLALN